MFRPLRTNGPPRGLARPSTLLKNSATYSLLGKLCALSELEVARDRIELSTLRFSVTERRYLLKSAESRCTHNP